MNWRYCILFFSRKQVTESEFFKPITKKDTLVKLENEFKKYSTKKKSKHPLLIGSFTSLITSQLVPASQYIRALRTRLETARPYKPHQAHHLKELFK